MSKDKTKKVLVQEEKQPTNPEVAEKEEQQPKPEDEFAHIKKNIPMSSINPLKLINFGNLITSAKSTEEKTVSFFDAMK